MIRAQIQFTPDQHRRLKRWARRLGISIAEAVRRCVDAHLDERASKGGREEMVREALSVVGKYADPRGRDDVGYRHDDYLDEAYRD